MSQSKIKLAALPLWSIILMGKLLRRIAEAFGELAEGELKWRKENPGEWANELRERELRYVALGRDGLARVAGRRAKRWEDKAAKVKP